MIYKSREIGFEERGKSVHFLGDEKGNVKCKICASFFSREMKGENDKGSNVEQSLVTDGVNADARFSQTGQKNHLQPTGTCPFKQQPPVGGTTRVILPLATPHPLDRYLRLQKPTTPVKGVEIANYEVG
ncbi:UNVERIFIED_CONTAM: hypothetical protein Sindi_0343700 [Sesamum indicum]